LDAVVASLYCMLWTLFRASNAFAMVARKNHPGAT
jgi:hypothetical protein